MKPRTRTILLSAAAVLLIIVAAAALILKDTIMIVRGNQNPYGSVSTVPEPRGNQPPPLDRSEFDWPRWRGPDGQARARIPSLGSDWSKGPRKIWQVDYLCRGRESAVWSAPVIQGTRLIVMGRLDSLDAVFCLNSLTGELIWHRTYETETGSSYGSGARATPWIDDDRVYTFSRGGDLICWSLYDGENIWHRKVAALGGEEHTWGHSSSPLILDSLAVVHGGGTARTIAFHKLTGDVIWTSGEGFPGYAALTAMHTEDGREIILSFHGKGLAGIDPATGRELWNIPWETDSKVNASTPAVISGDSLFVTSGYGFGCGLIKVSAEKAEILWQNTAIASHHSDPTVIDGYVYGYSGYSLQNRGSFKCLDPATGEELWSTNNLGWGTCIQLNDYLLCMDIKGNLFLVEPGPEGLKVAAEFPGALGKVRGAAWTVPVAARGRLYLRLKQTLICYELPD